MPRFFVLLAAAAATLSAAAYSADVHDPATSAGHAAPSSVVYHASGTVRAWSDDAVSIAHQPVPALHWPAMTMRFDLEGYQGEKFSAGRTIAFSFRQHPAGYSLISATAR